MNGKTYTVRTDSNGQVSIPVDTLKPGTYTAIISYKGSGNYKASSTVVTVTVTEVVTSFSFPDDVSVGYCGVDSNTQISVSTAELPPEILY